MIHQRGRFLVVVGLCLWALAISNRPVQAQFGNLLGGNSLLPPGGEEAGPAEPKLTMKIVPPTAKVGETVSVEITIGLDAKSYVYSQNPNVGAETRIELTETVGLEPIDAKFLPDRKPKVVVEPLFDNAKLEKFFNGVTWTRKYRVTATPARLAGTLIFQVCDEVNCTPYQEQIALALNSGASAPPAGASTELPSLKSLLLDEMKTPSAEPTGSTPAETVSQLTSPPAGAATATLVQGKVISRQELRSDRRVGGSANPAEFDVELIRDGSDSSRVALQVTARVASKWHLYALTQDPEMFALPTVITVAEVPGLTPVDAQFLPNSAPDRTEPLEDVIHLTHHDRVTWQRRFTIEPGKFAGTVSGSVRYQLCEDGSCLAPETLKFALNVDPAVSGTDAAPGTTISEGSATSPVEEEVPLQDQGLIPFLLTGIAFGYFALLTPCVFPMIPITISFFLKQAEKEHHNPVAMASLYCLGIVATFTVIGIVVSAIFGVPGMSMLANNIWFNLFLAGVLVFFGLNMLGMFEIRVPSSVLTWSSTRERQGGVLGVLFMSFTFTLVSFTCTFAFVGLLLPMAAQGNYYWPVLGMIAFSTAFASPFFFLALFPSFLKKLPKSGGWMNNVKVIFGLLELGAAFKFLSVADIGWFTAPYLFDYYIVMTAWMVLALVAGLYLLGLFRLHHDSPTDHIGVIRLGFAMLFLGFAAYLGAGIYGAGKPTGVVWEQIAAFAPPTYDTKIDVELGPSVEHDKLLYALDVDQAVKFAAANNEPLFFDFTGVNCVNCRRMEMTVFPKEANRELLSQFVRVQLYTDTIPQMKDPQQVEALLTRNRQLQSEWFNDATLPAYAIVTPDGQKILSSYKGNERTAGQFTRFLQTGLDEWQRLKTAAVPNSVRR